MKVAMGNRPVCSCGVIMKVVLYKGYYDEFKYWRCDNCDLDDKIQKMEPDKVESGSYA